jgi:acetyltransferase EpsM
VRFRLERKYDLKKILIIGGEGDGVVLASALEDLRASGQEVTGYGFLKDFAKEGEKIAGLPVLGKPENALGFVDKEDIFFMTALLKVKESYDRACRIEKLVIPPERYFSLIHPRATVSKTARIGFDTFVGPHVNVMPNAIIGNHCSFRASANVGHDCLIRDYCYMGPNSSLSGRVKLEEGAHIGPNACILGSIKIGEHSVVGPGSVVLKDIPGFVIAFGNPARIIERIKK